MEYWTDPHDWVPSLLAAPRARQDWHPGMEKGSLLAGRRSGKSALAVDAGLPGSPGAAKVWLCLRCGVRVFWAGGTPPRRPDVPGLVAARHSYIPAWSSNAASGLPPHGNVPVPDCRIESVREMMEL